LRRRRSPLDAVAQPLLERALDGELDGGRQHVAVGREDLLQEAAAEGRPVDPLARRGEQHLLDQVAHVLFGVGLRRPPPAVDVVGEVDLHQVPLTRI